MSAATRTKFAPWSGVDANDPATWGCEHRWVTVRVGDVVSYPSNPDERMVFCARCYAPRCGHTDDENPCMMARHHTTPHTYADGSTRPVGA